MDQILFWLVPAASVLALYFAWYFHCQMMKESEGTPQMIKIAAAVRKGAMSYLRQQYKIVGWVFLGLVILFSIMAYGFGVQNSWVPVAFLTGGFFSGLSGFLGMKTATYASARTANAARTSLNAGLRVAFRSGAVMGLVVVGLGLLDISFWYLLLNAVIPEDVMQIEDHAFSGCTGLKTIILLQKDPSRCIAGQHLLDGTGAEILVPQGTSDSYKRNYFWSSYAGKIRENTNHAEK